jgi:hypothetical protein
MSDAQDNQKDCQLRPFERNNYFYGKLMTVRDFQLEQVYLNGKRWLLNRLLFGDGTVCGLEVSSDNPPKIDIKSGIALDQCGREIVLSEAHSEDLLSLLNKANILAPAADERKEVYLYLSYHEDFKEKVKAQISSTCEEVCAPNRIVENFQVAVGPSAPEETPADFGQAWSESRSDSCSLSSPDGLKATCWRKVRRCVAVGDVVEITLYISAEEEVLNATVEDTLPPVLQLVYGSKKLGPVHLKAGQTVSQVYVVRVEQDAGTEITIDGKADASGCDSQIFNSGISVASHREVLTNIVDRWLQECPLPRDAGVLLALLIIEKQNEAIKISVDNTVRKLVYSTPAIADILEYLRAQAMGLEDQSAKLKARLGKSQIKLEATAPTTAGGQAKSTVTVSLVDDDGQPLPLKGIKVNLATTYGSLDFMPFTDENGQISTGENGQAVGTLIGAAAAATAVVIATTGICTAMTTVVFSTAQGTIKGTVTGPGGITPLAMVEVLGIEIRGNTAQGKYNLANVPAGPQTISASAFGYIAVTESVSVPAGGEVTKDFQLNPIPTSGNIFGTVKDKDDKAIAGATVEISGTTKSAKTDRGGKYALEAVPAGSQTVTASAPKFVSRSATVTLIAGQKVEVPFQLIAAVAKGTVKGKVTDASTKLGIVGAKVGVSKEVYTTSKRGGVYVLPNVPSGRQKVYAGAAGYDNAEVEVDIKADQEKPVNFELKKGGRIIEGTTPRERTTGPITIGGIGRIIGRGGPR